MNISGIAPGRLYTLASLPNFSINDCAVADPQYAVSVDDAEIYRAVTAPGIPVGISGVIRLALIASSRPLASVSLAVYAGGKSESIDFNVISAMPEDMEIPDGIDALQPFFTHSIKSVAIPYSEDPALSFLALQDVRIRLSSVMCGRRFILKTVGFSAKSSPFTHTFAYTPDIRELTDILNGQLEAEAAGSGPIAEQIRRLSPGVMLYELRSISAEIFPASDPGMEGPAADSLTFYISQKQPEVRIRFINRWLLPESFFSSGGWTRSRKVSRAVASVGSVIRAYDPTVENQFIISTQQMSTFEAEALARLADFSPDLEIKRYLGSRTEIFNAAVEEISVDSSADDSPKVTVKAVQVDDNASTMLTDNIHTAQFYPQMS